MTGFSFTFLYCRVQLETQHGSPSINPSGKALVLLLLLASALPLLLAVGVHFTAARPGLFGSLCQRLLGQASGEMSALPRPSLARLKTSSYQDGLARRFNAGYTGRNWVHRCTQEACLRLFDTVQRPAVLGRRKSNGSNICYENSNYWRLWVCR